MLSMNLTGPPGVMIRESPTRQSTGKTSIIDIPGPMWHIDSFFDVFTELSVDGGLTWMPNTARNHFRADGTGSTRVFWAACLSRPAWCCWRLLGWDSWVWLVVVNDYLRL